MKKYRAYMDRQQVSPALHARLAALEQNAGPAPDPRQPASLRHWRPLLAAAACLCLVLGLSWALLSAWRSGASDAASSVSESFDTTSMDTADSVLESADAEAADGEAAEIADGASADGEASEEASDSEASAGKDSLEDSSAGDAEDGAASGALPLPEDALCPGWLPEDSTLVEAEPLDGDGYRLVWRTVDGAELTMEYFHADETPAETDWTVCDWDSADWAQLSASGGEDGLWGFGLYDSESGLFCQFTTTGADHEQLCRMAQSVEP